MHWGARSHKTEALMRTRAWILKNDAVVWDLGDPIELATRHSVGAGVYEQTISPDEQIDKLLDFYEPIVDRGLLLGMVDSNHAFRAYKEVGINITKQVARTLGVPYFGHSGFLLLRVGDITYKIFGHHGTSGSATFGGKVNSVTKLGRDVDCDIVVMAHVHDIHHHTENIRGINNKTKCYEERAKHYVITGSYVGHEGYPEQANYTPVTIGTPALVLSGDERNVEFIRNISV